MPSRTSYFNKTVFTKTVTRFWPLWLAYTAVWFITLPLSLSSQLSSPYHSATSVIRGILETSIYGGVIIGAIFAVLSAMAVWSFMYSARSAHGTASLPINREGIFVSVTLAGIIPLLIANILVFLFTLLVSALNGEVYLTALFTWLGVSSLTVLFFYGFATFCAQLTGNTMVLPLVYAVLNFTAVVVESIVKLIFSSFVYGLSDASDTFVTIPLSPAIQMVRDCGYIRILDNNGVLANYSFYGWSTLAIYAAVGAVFVVFALLIYRKRRMESAGDVVAVNILKPVFKYCLTLGCALVLGYLLYALSGVASGPQPGVSGVLTVTAFMLIGAFIGYFAAQMLLKKSLKVLTQGWTGFLVSAALIVALMFSMEFDLFGYESYTPDAEDIESVHLWVSGCGHTEFKDPENIKSAIAIHKSIIENKNYYEDKQADYWGYEWYDYTQDYSTNTVEFTYTLKGSNRTILRVYTVHHFTDDPETYGDTLELQNLLNTEEAILDRNETAFKFNESTIIGGGIDVILPAADCARLYGFEDVESFLLGYYNSIYGEDIKALTNAERLHILYETVRTWAVNYGTVMEEAGALERIDIQVTEKYEDIIDEESKKEFLAGTINPLTLNIDYEKFTFNYYFTLDATEISKLYSECIVPDMEDGSLNKVYLIGNADHLNTTYSATISINARIEDLSDATVSGITSGEEEKHYIYDSISIKPTVDSERVNEWLLDHGIPLYTLSQVQ